MKLLNTQGKIVEEKKWSYIDDVSVLEGDTPSIVSFPVLKGFLNQELKNQSVGVLLTSEEIPEVVDGWLERLCDLGIVVIQFDDFKDGRGFTLAKHLKLLNYQGELRATGEVRAERIELMVRCGFDSFEIEPLSDEVAYDFENTLNAFQQHYQSDEVENSQAIYVRRFGGENR